MTESCRSVFRYRRLLRRLAYVFAEKSPSNENAPTKIGYLVQDSMIPETIRRQCGKLSATAAAPPSRVASRNMIMRCEPPLAHDREGFSLDEEFAAENR